MRTVDNAVIDFSKLDRLIGGGLAAEYASARPFPHLMIDGFLDADLALEAAREARAIDIPVDPNFYGSFEKFKLSDSRRFPPAIARIMRTLNSDEFLARLERITSIPKLEADESLEGGGVHRIGRGGFLKIHTDFNFHRLKGTHRRLNLLVYLNPEWDPDWGGSLELWEPDMSSVAKAFEPKFNRAILFTTTDGSYHGHPEPLATPEGIYRSSLALYYYTRAAPAESRFGKSEMTNYRPRPGEHFGRKHTLHQFIIRTPVLRPLVKAVTRLLGK